MDVTVNNALLDTQRAFDGVASDYDRANAENAILCAVAEGAGIAIVDRGAIDTDGRIAVLDVTGFPRARTWHLAYPVGASPCPAARALLRHARDAGVTRHGSGAQSELGSGPAP